MAADLFPGFERIDVDAGEVVIHAVRGGQGPPVLLLHGYPQTHAMWHRVAPALARHFTVVAADLRGYGDSAKPPGDPDHVAYAKRTMAADQVAVMRRLGHDRFAVVGHDRGARVAYRLALDHPDRVTALAVLDVVPTLVMFENVDRAMAMRSFHWFFLSQPTDLPERLIGAQAAFYLRWMLASWSASGLDAFAPEALAEYLRCSGDPAAIHAACEDYRAGATVDLELDRADRGRRRIACPVLALWGERRPRAPAGSGGPVSRSPLEVWREWADDVRGGPVACGHFLPEEAPEETAARVLAFLRDIKEVRA